MLSEGQKQAGERSAFSFNVIDEPFNGTNPRDGQCASYSVVEAMSNYKTAFHIVATHYPVVTLLPPKYPAGGFGNYTIAVKRNPKTNKIVYTYKVVPGISRQTTGIDLLEQELGRGISSRARDMQRNPQKYQGALKNGY